MVWHLKNDGGVWSGAVHELAGRTFSGATRTPDSKPLLWIEPKRKYTVSKPSKPRKKQPPKAKGATAWD